ncbi:DUF6183 family protein [Gemmata sp.]|uniref:DUF6183 family protein n=1 Tax=Gemmata sp. TaxID=1914242 RepID=UPI003F706D7A
MTEDEALFLAAVANPAETTPALALADWFDEHDEPSLATALRGVPQLVPLLHSLRRWDEVPAWGFQVYESGAMREAWDLLPAARMLTRYRHLFPTTPETPVAFDPAAPPARKYGDTLNTAAFLGNWRHYRQRQVAALREQVAQRAANWTASQRISARIPKGLDAFEWKSCLIHELVLRDCTPGGRAVADHVAAMRERGHPLAWLPLERHAIEAGLLVNQGWQVTAAQQATSRTLSDPPPRPVELGRAAAGSRAFAAVRQWQAESNGDADAAAFVFDRPLTVARHGLDWLPAFPQSLLGNVEGHAATFRPMSSTDALRGLFNAARGGSVYGRGVFGAYSRLHAWQSMGWLTGCGVEESVERIALRAEACEWFWFDSHELARSVLCLSILCVRPDRLSAAVLAAIDDD